MIWWIPLLGQKTVSQDTIDICTPTLIAALFTIAKLWNQPGCPSIEEWMKKMWYRATLLWVPSCLGGAFISFTSINFISYN
jgi:hypothetical protein